MATAKKKPAAAKKAAPAKKTVAKKDAAPAAKAKPKAKPVAEDSPAPAAPAAPAEKIVITSPTGVAPTIPERAKAPKKKSLFKRIFGRK